MFKNQLLFLPLFICLVFAFITSCSPAAKEPVKNSDTLKTPTISKDTLPTAPFVDYSCIYKKTNKTLVTTFPFNEATKIQVVSYVMRNRAYAWDTLISKGQFIVKGIKEKVALSKEQTDTLFSLFYDYHLNPKSDISMADCYTPRHSVVFYKNNEAIAFYEICFDCGGIRKTKDVDFGTMCPEKMDKFKNFFKSIGISYSMGEPPYPVD